MFFKGKKKSEKNIPRLKGKRVQRVNKKRSLLQEIYNAISGQKKNYSTKPRVDTSGKEMMILFFVVSLFLAYLGMLFAASAREGDTLFQIYENFNSFVIKEKHFIVGVTPKTGLFIGILEMIWFVAFLLMVSEKKYAYKGVEYGVAHFQDPAEFTNKYINKDYSNEVFVNTGKLHKKSFIINTHNRWISENCYVDIDNKLTSNLNTLVVGPPGCGKSFRLARPILSGLNGMYLVTDPKGELLRTTGQFFLDNGYEILVVDTRDAEGMLNSVRFNPFVYIKDQKGINETVEVLLKSTTPPDSMKGDPFWEKSETLFFSSLFELLFYSYPMEKRTWRSLIRLIDTCEVTPDGKGGIMPNLLMREMEEYNEKWKEAHNGETHPAYQDYKDIFGGAFETVASIILSAKVRIKNMKLESALSMMDYDEMDIAAKFGHGIKSPESPAGKRILYILTQEGDHSMDWYISILYMTFFRTLYRVADKECDGKLPYHITYLMDEFANVTLASNFKDLLSTMRSRNMSAIIIVQSLMQIKQKYPNNDADKELIGHCCFMIVLGPPEQESREYTSKMLGTMTVDKSTTTATTTWNHAKAQAPTKSDDVMQMELMSAGNIGVIPMTDCIIRINGDFPVYDEKVKMEKSPFYPLLCRKKPFVFSHKNNKKRSKVIYVGKEAEAVIESAKISGNPVITVTEGDIKAMIQKQRLENFHAEKAKDKEVISNEVIEKNRRDFIKKINSHTINYEDYSMEQMMVVQRLQNQGFSPEQVHALDSFILKNRSFDEIIKFFNPAMPHSQISLFVERLVASNSVTV